MIPFLKAFMPIGDMQPLTPPGMAPTQPMPPFSKPKPEWGPIYEGQVPGNPNLYQDNYTLREWKLKQGEGIHRFLDYDRTFPGTPYHPNNLREKPLEDFAQTGAQSHLAGGPLIPLGQRAAEMAQRGVPRAMDFFRKGTSPGPFEGVFPKPDHDVTFSPGEEFELRRFEQHLRKPGPKAEDYGMEERARGIWELPQQGPTEEQVQQKRALVDAVIAKRNRPVQEVTPEFQNEVMLKRQWQERGMQLGPWESDRDPSPTAQANGTMIREKFVGPYSGYVRSDPESGAAEVTVMAQNPRQPNVPTPVAIPMPDRSHALLFLDELLNAPRPAMLDDFKKIQALMRQRLGAP